MVFYIVKSWFKPTSTNKRYFNQLEEKIPCFQIQLWRRLFFRKGILTPKFEFDQIKRKINCIYTNHHGFYSLLGNGCCWMEQHLKTPARKIKTQRVTSSSLTLKVIKTKSILTSISNPCCTIFNWSPPQLRGKVQKIRWINSWMKSFQTVQVIVVRVISGSSISLHIEVLYSSLKIIF